VLRRLRRCFSLCTFRFSKDFKIEIIYSSKNEQTFFEYRAVFGINNCKKVIVTRDIDNSKDGIVVCYDSQTLNIENINSSNDYFDKIGNNINFNSQEFIGQTSNIEIYNNVGTNVGKLLNGIINQPNYIFNIPELPSGAYYLQCQLPNQSINFNFVVVR